VNEWIQGITDVTTLATTIHLLVRDSQLEQAKARYPNYAQEKLSYTAVSAGTGARFQYRIAKSLYLSFNYLMNMSKHRFSVDGTSYATAQSLSQAQRISYSFLEKQSVIGGAFQMGW